MDGMNDGEVPEWIYYKIYDATAQGKPRFQYNHIM